VTVSESNGELAGASWGRRIAVRLEEIVNAGRWRAPQEFDARGPAGRLVSEGCDVVSFGSNDYLGLSTHPQVVAAARGALERWGTGSGGSRLLTGTRPVHRALEAALADFKGTEAAACFPTGFAANLGTLSALAGRGTRVLSDELNHASIIDGCRLSRAAVTVYRHCDVDHVEALLRSSTEPTIVVTDSVFSMDGDVAPVGALAEACERHGALLVLDEAHGVLGPELVSTASDDLEVLRVGTLSKTLGSLGGFVAGRRALIDLVINVSRPYIFTTALSPADAAAALAALEVLRSAEGDRLKRRLAAHVHRLRPGHPSPIVPIVLGSESAALAASAALLKRGIWVPAVRPPTVPAGSSRLRVTLSAAHTTAQVQTLIEALASLGASIATPSTVDAGDTDVRNVPSKVQMLGVGATVQPRASTTSDPARLDGPMAQRPARVVAVVGTRTGVGKTWVAAKLLRSVRQRGLRVSARKPVQSAEDTEDPLESDASVLAQATGEDPEGVCPPHRRYGLAMAPPIAAELLGRPRIVLEELLGELGWYSATPAEPGVAAPSPGFGLIPADLGVVETVGGVRSPMADDGDSLAFCRLLRPDLVILVADAGLGAISDVGLAARALDPLPTVVLLNHFDHDDEVHRMNRRWLRERDGLDVLVIPDEWDEVVQAVLKAGSRSASGVE